MDSIISSLCKFAALAAAVFALAALAGRVLDTELDAHSHAAFGSAYDPAD